MSINLHFKRLVTAAVLLAIVLTAFFVHALAGLNSSPVIFSAPPEFVARYASQIERSNPSILQDTSKIIGGDNNEPQPVKLTVDYSNHQALVHKAIFDGESHDQLLALFSHPEKAQRVKMALALAAINVEFTHNEESGFEKKREQFWVDVEQHLPDIQNALYEALITSAQEETVNRIPYTLAWMRGQDHQTVELLAWAAKHHPDWWVRRFSVYFVVRFGGDEKLAAPLLRNRTHDPDYRVRKQVLDLRIKNFIGAE